MNDFKIGTNSYVDWAAERKELDKKFCVVIPAYRKLVYSEAEALKQMHKILKNKNNVYILYPERLDIREHKALFPELKETCLEDKWFESTDTYSQLLIRDWFYKMFEEYEYMLICQLDVWLTKDDILEWCDKDYEYIGAPIVVHTARWHNYRIDSKGNVIVTPKIGNGGFSLRKISTFIELTDPSSYIAKRYNIVEAVASQVKYEDLWFCDVLSEYYDMEMPSYKKAFSFSIDMNPDIVESIYKVTELPTGIHAFDKNIPYWEKRIPELSSQKMHDCCYEANKEFIDIYYYKKHDNSMHND